MPSTTQPAKGYKKMAKDPEGNSYVAERSVDGDAVLKVVKIDQSAKTAQGVVYWPKATYSVWVPGTETEPVKIIRYGAGHYEVPGKGTHLPMIDAVRIALGRMQPPAAREHRATVRPVRAGRSSARQAQEHNASTARQRVRDTPEVKQEPQENWQLQQGDRIMRHLALYPEGVDPQTMSAGMHEVPTSKVRAHLRRMMKNEGPVIQVRTGIYARREAS